MRITLRTSKSADGSLSLYQAIQHFAALVKANGLLPAVQTTLSTARQLFFRDGGGISFRGGQIEENDLPVLRGASRRWAAGLRHLIGIHNYYQQNGFPSEHTDFIVFRLQELVEKSPNSPQNARVTIVIPAFNSFHEVANCIESVFSHQSKTHFRILIADDASPNVSYSSLAVLDGVSLLRQTFNLGYIGNVNAATAFVNTEFLLTLNQDVVVCPGWLDELVIEADRNPQFGVVGPQVLDQDFKILEAGGTIFQEAHAAHRGRGYSPEDSRFNYSCDVDYVSGCAMLVRTSLWRQLGGLDTQYAPAYYDDTDFCLRSRKAGWRIRLAPLARIVHFEGTSMGFNEFDTNSLKHFQVINREKVAANHPVLATHSSIADHPRTDCHSASKNRIVCVFESWPDKNRDSGSLDSVLFVDYLLELGYSVIALFVTDVALEKTAGWRALGVMCTQLETDGGVLLLNSSDVVISFGIIAAMRTADKSFDKNKWINFTSDCATRRLEAMQNLMNSQKFDNDETPRWYLGLPTNVEQMWEIEKPTLELPAVSLFVTTHDKDYAINRRAEGQFIHFPILRGAPNSASDTTAPSELTVGFVGSFLHSPNPDAVDYFLRDIWPTITNMVPTSRFLIWGSNINEKKRTDWSQVSGVEVRGWFATWDEVAAQTRVLVSPLRFGAGMKGKVVSSIINGRPVVGTSISFEGFEIQHLGDNVVSDDPTQIARSIIEILNADEAWKIALKSGLAGMGTGFSRNNEVERVRDLVSPLLSS